MNNYILTSKSQEAAHIILQNITSKSEWASLYIDLKCGFRGNKQNVLKEIYLTFFKYLLNIKVVAL